MLTIEQENQAQFISERIINGIQPSLTGCAVTTNGVTSCWSIALSKSMSENKNQTHAKLGELSPGVRRRYLLIASALMYLGFSVFLLSMGCWITRLAQPSDIQVLVLLGLLNGAVGITYGIRSRLSQSFVDQPAWFDLAMLALAACMLIAASCLSIAWHRY